MALALAESFGHETAVTDNPPDILTILVTVLVGVIAIFIGGRMWRLKRIIAEEKALNEEWRALEPDGEQIEFYRRFGVKRTLWQVAKIFLLTLVASYWAVLLLGRYVAMSADTKAQLVVVLAALPLPVFLRMRNAQMTDIIGHLDGQNLRLQEILARYEDINRRYDKLGEDLEHLKREIEKAPPNN